MAEFKSIPSRLLRLGGTSPRPPTPQLPVTAPTQLPQPSSGWMFDTNGATDFGRWSEWAPYILQSQLQGGAQQGIRDLYASLPVYGAARNRAIQALSPGGEDALIQSFMQKAFGGADELGRRNAAALRASGVQGQDAAAALDARNRAADATNDFSGQLYSPEGQAERAQQVMGLSSPEAAFPLLKLIMMLDPSIQQRVGSNNAEHAARASSGLGGIIGNIAGMLTGGGFGNLFGRGGGGGGTSPSVPVPSGGGWGGGSSIGVNFGSGSDPYFWSPRPRRNP